MGSSSVRNTELALTGERTLPGIPEENYWFRRHEAAYDAVAGWCEARRVLEAGCGEGYGAERLRRSGARTVIGLDYDEITLTHSRRAYPEVRFVRANLVALPFCDGQFDLVASLQTVEHVWDQPAFVRECARVLAPGGRLVLTTPNRRTFPPGNPFHSRELDAAELAALVSPALQVVELLGVRHGTRILEYEREHGDLVEAQLAAPPEQWPTHLAAFVAGVRAGDFVLSQEDLDSSLDLYLVAEPR